MQLQIRLKKYASNIKLNKFRLSNANSNKRQADIRIRLTQLQNQKQYLQIIEADIKYVMKYMSLTKTSQLISFGNNNNNNNNTQSQQLGGMFKLNQINSKTLQDSDTISENMDNITDNASECVVQYLEY